MAVPSICDFGEIYATSLDVSPHLQTTRHRLVVVSDNSVKVASFDVRFDFHTFSFSLLDKTLKIERRRRIPDFVASVAAHSYRRKREAELLAGWKIFCAQKKSRACDPALLFNVPGLMTTLPGRCCQL
jgi:hypothetical protein